MARRFIQHALSLAPTEVQDPFSQGRRVHLKPLQAVVWVSFTPLSYQGAIIPPGAPLWPALLDPGHNHNLSIRGADTGLTTAQLSGLMDDRRRWLEVEDASGQVYRVPRLLGNLWLHSNLAEAGERPLPYRIALGNSGISCFTEEVELVVAGPSAAVAGVTRAVPQGPHLPLLGLNTLCQGSIELSIACNPGGGIVALSIPETGWTEANS